MFSHLLIAGLAVAAGPALVSASTQCGAGLTACGEACYDASASLYHCCSGVLEQGPTTIACPAGVAPAATVATAAATTDPQTHSTTAAAAPSSTLCGAGLSACGAACYDASAGLYHCCSGVLEQ